eukprot:gnl/TRDRNA2_/TRDRNA2_127614_c3_seq1.p1 gnl/TRDRNA2_/TRDRNA2_127614_c3~~gnl/TRDRNA2_/TRDRNA2_127614_c3_seq1.p1  ORF type:complete len:387 (+),score=49.75 gnl/TRDRNA2_/TRDRNA2_127614_c3_seq1:100-1260(+)
MLVGGHARLSSNESIYGLQMTAEEHQAEQEGLEAVDPDEVDPQAAKADGFSIPRQPEVGLLGLHKDAMSKDKPSSMHSDQVMDSEILNNARIMMEQQDKEELEATLKIQLRWHRRQRRMSVKGCMSSRRQSRPTHTARVNSHSIEAPCFFGESCLWIPIKDWDSDENEHKYLYNAQCEVLCELICIPRSSIKQIIDKFSWLPDRFSRFRNCVVEGLEKVAERRKEAIREYEITHSSPIGERSPATPESQPSSPEQRQRRNPLAQSAPAFPSFIAGEGPSPRGAPWPSLEPTQGQKTISTRRVRIEASAQPNGSDALISAAGMPPSGEAPSNTHRSLGLLPPTPPANTRSLANLARQSAQPAMARLSTSPSMSMREPLLSSQGYGLP